MKAADVIGSADGHGLEIGVVVSTFNEVITAGLFDEALRGLEEAGVAAATVIRVPGALEIPLAAQKLIRSGCDAVVALGAVIQGETDHYEHVATQTSAGILRVALETGVPVANGVLTVREFEHARQRSLPGNGNKGYEAARAAVQTVNALRGIDDSR